MVMYKTFLNQNSKSITFHLLLPLHLLIIFVPPTPQKQQQRTKRKNKQTGVLQFPKRVLNTPLIAPDPYTLQSQGGYEGLSLKEKKRGGNYCKPASLKTRTG